MKPLFSLAFLTSIFVWGLCCSGSTVVSKTVQYKTKVNTVYKNSSEKKEWRLDSLIQRKSDSKGGWLNKSKSVYAYNLKNNLDSITTNYLWTTNEDNKSGFWELNSKTVKLFDRIKNQDSIVITYTDYLSSKKKFNAKIESRINCNKSDLVSSSCYHDKDWTGENLTLKITDSLEYVKSFMVYQKKEPTKTWQNIETKKDSFNSTSQLMQSYSMSLRNNYLNVSLVNYQYKDQHLIEKITKKNESQSSMNWINSNKETFEYDRFNNMVKETRAYWDEKNLEWKNHQETNWDRSGKNGKINSKTYLETVEDIGFIITSKLEYLYDGNLNTIKETSSQFNTTSKKLTKNYVFDFILDEQGLLLEKKVKNFDNGGYDQVNYKYDYDSEGRLLKEVHKNKNNDSSDWRFVSSKEFRYKISGEKYTYKKTISSKKTVHELIEYVFDEENNIILINMDTASGSILKRTVTYDKEINKRDVLFPKGMNFIHQTYNGEWDYINAPLIKESLSFYNEKWNGLSADKFYYSKN